MGDRAGAEAVDNPREKTKEHEEGLGSGRTLVQEQVVNVGPLLRWKEDNEGKPRHEVVSGLKPFRI